VDRGMSCNLCESPGFLACTTKFALFHENRIFGRSQSLLLQTLKKSSALPRIRAREIESYSPFEECQQEARRKFSKATSGKDGNESGQLALSTHRAKNTRICRVLHYLSGKSSQRFPIDEQLAR